MNDNSLLLILRKIGSCSLGLITFYFSAPHVERRHIRRRRRHVIIESFFFLQSAHPECKKNSSGKRTREIKCPWGLSDSLNVSQPQVFYWKRVVYVLAGIIGPREQIVKYLGSLTKSVGTYCLLVNRRKEGPKTLDRAIRNINYILCSASWTDSITHRVARTVLIGKEARSWGHGETQSLPYVDSISCRSGTFVAYQSSYNIGGSLSKMKNVPGTYRYSEHLEKRDSTNFWTSQDGRTRLTKFNYCIGTPMSGCSKICRILQLYSPRLDNSNKSCS